MSQTRKIIVETETDDLVFEILDSETILGRDAACDVVLDGDRVSRRHLKIVRVGDELLAEDMGSSNGTLVNDVELDHKTVLEAGDCVTVGDRTVWIDRRRVRAVGTPADTEPAGSAGRLARRSSGGYIPFLVVAGLLVALLLYRPWESMAPERTRPTPENTSAETVDDPPQEQSKVRTAPKTEVDTAAVERSWQTLSLEVDECLVQDNFAKALRLVDEFENDYGQWKTDGLTVRIRRAAVTAAQADQAEYEKHLAAGAHDVAAATLRDRLDRYERDGETARRFERLITEAENHGILERNKLTARRDAAKPTTPAASGGSGAKKAGRRTNGRAAATAEARKAALVAYRDALTKADAAQTARDWLEASRQWKTAAEKAVSAGLDYPVARQAARRSRIAESLDGYKQALIEAILRDPGSYRKIPVMPGRRGHVTEADDDAVTFDIDGETVVLKWKVLRKEALVAMTRGDVLEGAKGVFAGAFLFEAERPDLANRVLRDCHLGDGGLKRRIDEVLADAAGMDVPSKGFMWLGDRYVTPRDMERILTKTKITELLAEMDSDDKETRDVAYEKLFLLGDRAASDFHRGLLESKANLIASLEKSKPYKQLRNLHQRRLDLDRARDAALELIFDTEKYPYPYRGRGQAVMSMYQETQQAIDKRVAVVRKLWKESRKVSIPDGIRVAGARLRELNSQLARLGLGMGPEDPAYVLHLPEEDEVSLQTYAIDEEERGDIDRSYEYIRLNATAPTMASVGERSQIRITNQYRVMMGRHAVRINEKLVKAARMHCEDMARLGFFSHFNEKEPKKRTPRDRATYVGFQGAGISENIAINGGAQGAHNAWCHSSGHHRNILSKSWRILGVGNSGNRWCQNFSIREYTEAERAAGEADEGYSTPEDGR